MFSRGLEGAHGTVPRTVARQVPRDAGNVRHSLYMQVRRPSTLRPGPLILATVLDWPILTTREPGSGE